jgi:predicted nucleic-acid-binding Zn-ribbon protein
MVNKKSLKAKRGGGFFTTDVKTYANLSYPKSDFRLPKLVCTVRGCNGDEFKNHVVKLGTQKKSFLLDTDVFDNAYNAFTCLKCGFVQFYSRKLVYVSTKISKKSSRRSSK